jgi:C4-dicarboxylate transporter/malic acid transport protein
MTVIAAGLGVVLLILYASRLVLHSDAALADRRDPAVGALYGTVPGAILVLAAATAAVGPTWFAPSMIRDLVAVLDWVGIPLAFVVSLAFAHTLFLRAELAPEAVNGGWFIPPVVNIVVPLGLVPLVPGSSPTTARTLLFLSYGFWGMGFMLYLIIIAMLYQRLVLHPVPHAGLAPSLWIGLGPIGVGSLALLKIAAVGGSVFGAQGPTVALASKLVATALWGFGAWWLLVATMLLVHYLRSGSLPYGIGWWGFSFPLGAYTVATLALAQAWNLISLQWVGASLFVVLSVFWIVVVARTLVALGTGEFTHGSRPTATIQVPNK